jgi:hypothetical protein
MASAVVVAGLFSLAAGEVVDAVLSFAGAETITERVLVLVRPAVAALTERSSRSCSSPNTRARRTSP